MNGMIVTIEVDYFLDNPTFKLQVLNADKGLYIVQTYETRRLREAEAWARSKAQMYGAVVRRKSGNQLSVYNFKTQY